MNWLSSRLYDCKIPQHIILRCLSSVIVRVLTLCVEDHRYGPWSRQRIDICNISATPQHYRVGIVNELTNNTFFHENVFTSEWIQHCQLPFIKFPFFYVTVFIDKIAVRCVCKHPTREFTHWNNNYHSFGLQMIQNTGKIQVSLYMYIYSVNFTKTIKWLIDWLINYCLMSSEQYFSYIPD